MRIIDRIIERIVPLIVLLANCPLLLPFVRTNNAASQNDYESSNQCYPKRKYKHNKQQTNMDGPPQTFDGPSRQSLLDQPTRNIAFYTAVLSPSTSKPFAESG